MTPGPSDTNESGSRNTNQVIWLNEIRPRPLTAGIAGFLRHGTQTLIDSRNAHLDLLDLDQPRRYRDYLRSEAEALLPLEAAVERSGVTRLLPDWPRRARSNPLGHDLLALDIFCDPLPAPALKSIAEMFGVCYALEATRMGSRIVLAKLAAAKPDDASMASMSFLRHGRGQRFWPSFLDALESHRDAATHPGQILHAAQMALGMFESVRASSRHPAGVA